ncbi:hypothetical protein D3C72_1329440 [compost metagenome]
MGRWPDARHGRPHRRRGAVRGPGARHPGRRRGDRPSRQAARAGFHRHPRALSADRHHRVAVAGPAALARHLHLPRGTPLQRARLRARRGRVLHRRAAAQRHHHGDGLEHGARHVGRRAVRREPGPQPAHDHGQGADGPQLPRIPARHGRERRAGLRRPDLEVAQQGPAGLRHHAALRADLHRGATGRLRRTGARPSGRLHPDPRGREPRRGEMGGRAVPRRPQLPGRVRPLQPAAPRRVLRPCDLPRPGRPPPAGRQRRRRGALPHLEPVPGQRLL